MDNDEQRRIFSRNLRYYISQSGKQQREIARALGFHHNTFNTWCRGLILPSLDKIQKIADYFGISKDVLLGDRDLLLTETETKVIRAYRAAPESRKEAVRILLDVREKGNEEQQQAPSSA